MRSRDRLTDKQRYDQAFRLALEILQTEQNSEPPDPKGDHEMVIQAETWARMRALALQAVQGLRGPWQPGICRRCGCTWLAACEKPCSWANVDHTLCSNCVGAPAAPKKKGGRRASTR